MTKANSEILAPAGSFEAVYAAVACGADAVYFGGHDFNARKNAANFTDEEFAQAVKYCHQNSVKVYQTVNTIVYDSELPALVSALKRSCEAGVDALIIQDLAVYSIVKSCCPDMPLHASTQMSVHTLAGALQLKNMGFSRVVLSREMSREQIKNIAQNADIELEVFVHGALCMCVSGQCYLSAMLGRRSGNRGLCAQPCRLPFSSDGSRDRYDLSLKDLSLVDKLRELEKIGVKSFKIEGRMKRPEYVAAAVTACRESLNIGKVSDGISQKLASVFSRSGFTDGYYTSKKGKSMFGTRQKQDVVSADSDVLKSLADLYKNRQRNIPIDMKLVLSDKKAELTVFDGKNRAVCENHMPVPAEKLPTDFFGASKSLSKTGSTPYALNHLHFENPDRMFMPVSAINDLRRTALEKLSEIRSQGYSHQFDSSKISLRFSEHKVDTPRLYMRFRRKNDVTEAAENAADRIILPIDEIDAQVAHKYGDRLICELWRGKFSNEDVMQKKLKDVYALGCTKAIASGIGDILLCEAIGIDVIGGFGLNISNTLALESYSKLGLSEAILSFELSAGKIAKIGGDIPRGIIGYGRLPLMLTANCPIKNTVDCSICKKSRYITDRLGNRFPVVCSNGCSEILNCQPLYLADRLSEIKVCDFLVLYFTTESHAETDEVISDYTHSFKKRENITRGLLFRGSL